MVGVADEGLMVIPEIVAIGSLPSHNDSAAAEQPQRRVAQERAGYDVSITTGSQGNE